MADFDAQHKEVVKFGVAARKELTKYDKELVKLQDKNEGKLEENLDSLVTALEDAAYNEEHREALAEEMEGSLEGARVLHFRACN